MNEPNDQSSAKTNPAGRASSGSSAANSPLSDSPLADFPPSDSQLADFPSATFTGEGLTVLRGGRAVFAGLSFSVESGRALRLAGPNGSGKSTLIRVMAGLLRPTLGTMSWDGEDLQADPDAQAGRLVHLGHADCLKPALTAFENASVALRLRGTPPSEIGARLEAAFEALAIQPLRDLPAGWLSSGQRRRTALAVVIASDAPLWLLDEPTVGLDSASVAALERALAAHLARGGMVVAATHTALELGVSATDLDPADFTPTVAALKGLGGGGGGDDGDGGGLADGWGVA